MKKILGLMLALLPAGAMGGEATFTPPPWAYPRRDPDFQLPKDDGLPKHVPGSSKSFTMGQILSLFDGIPDWHPDEHPQMPAIVERGRRPDVGACAVCHLPNGMGHPESSSLAGLSANYIIQQMQDFKTEARKSAMPGRSTMAIMAKVITDDEVREAAAYFSNLPPVSWTTVKESDSAPVTYVGLGNMRHAKPNGGTEPMGTRIIEVPVDSERAELRDTHSPFIAYVPVGSIKKGEALVTTGGNGKTIACGVCHGPDLKGLGDVPGIAGRSPTYVARQLFDMQQGARNGAGAQLMKTVVAKLTEDDIVNIAAYAASRPF